jgi:hypothetical protein
MALLFLVVAWTPIVQRLAIPAHRLGPDALRRSSFARMIEPLSSDEVQSIAKRYGLEMRVSGYGLGVKVELVDAERQTVLGDSYAFAQPNGVLHWDSIQTRRLSGYYERRNAARRGSRAEAKADRGDAKGAVAFGIYGPSALMAAAMCAWVKESAPFGCHTAEILAIDDDSRQHKVLVRFYKVVGLKPVRQVDEGFTSIPDRLLYGGCGTIMQVPTNKLAVSMARMLQGNPEDETIAEPRRL